MGQDERDGELYLGRKKPSESWVEVRSGVSSSCDLGIAAKYRRTICSLLPPNFPSGSACMKTLLSGKAMVTLSGAHSIRGVPKL